MASTTAPAQQTRSANRFTLNDATSTIKITFYPQAPGPLTANEPHGGPLLVLQDGKETRDFKGDAISINRATTLGELITVTLRPDADAGAIYLTLILPTVNLLQGSKKEHFKTIAIRTTTQPHVIALHGPDRTYQTIDLNGLAESVILAH
jgi:hypothetical protein